MNKKVVFSTVALTLVLSLTACNSEVYAPNQEKQGTENVSQESKETVENPKTQEKEIPREYTAALNRAEDYANSVDMSKKGIYEQLTSEYGDKFPKDAAEYAIKHVKANWKENALKRAEDYARTSDMSNEGIYEQLTSEYGDKFTKDEAKYAIDNLK